ncbi:MAG: ADP-dependent NAD(P)H-hydrate dehydratase / NAD(P)H-hydrate epimerase [Actinomycetota bacterium]|nr:ADP-dependent NAD(P)H-hydrate dehydratase / NAD(P)H-hydrate epimerase [Actinomycetota bacterium]
MKPVLTPSQAGELDRAAQADGVGADVLMERAGRALARAVLDITGGTYGRRAVIVCGKGNNGGDGFVAARHLARAGAVVRVHLIEEPAPGVAREQMERALGETLARVSPFSPGRLARDLVHADVAVDAIFGTGFRGNVRDEWSGAIDEINASGIPVVSADIPSGVDGTSGAALGSAVRAQLTVSFGPVKTGVALMPGAEFAGDVRVADIGLPADRVRTDVFLSEPGDVAAILPERAADAHKRASGHVVVVAGSADMTGAAVLVASAAARMGAGLVTVAAPRGIIPVLQSRLSEAIFLPLPETSAGSVVQHALEPVLDALDRANALVLGPGMSTQVQTAGFVRDLVRSSPVPLVLDADGLTAFAGFPGELSGRKSAAVLTPHAGEFSRLLDVSVGELETDRIGFARRLAEEADAVTLLKGSRSLIAEPGGTVRINPTGSSVLATAGTGDVLAGVIGALLARGVAAADAAAAGAYLHGLAGLLAGQASGEGTIASDVVALIPEAVAGVRSA